jgi:hypothetical protein
VNLRDKILAANDRTFEVLHVPEWDCDVRVYTMTAGDKTRIVKLFNDGVPDDYFARLVYLCVCDENGVRVFSESDIKDLQDKSAIPVSRIAEVASRLNKLNETPEALAEKNSETIPDGSTAIE